MKLAKKFAREYAASNPELRISWAAAKDWAPRECVSPEAALRFANAFADELTRLGIARPRGGKSTQSLASRLASGRVRRLLNLRAEASAALDRVSRARGLSLSDTVSDLVLAADSETKPV